MTERSRTPFDRVADVFIFGPLGFALEARALWPRLARRGRGELAKVQEHTGAALHGLGLLPRPNDDGRILSVVPDDDDALDERDRWAGDGHGAPDAREADPDGSAGPDTGVSPAAPEPAPPAVPMVDPATLAIPDYDSLSASQVVPRLDGLDTDELERVRNYEAVNRGRKTILNKIAQLQSA